MKTYKLGKQISSGPAKYAEGGIVQPADKNYGITDKHVSDRAVTLYNRDSDYYKRSRAEGEKNMPTSVKDSPTMQKFLDEGSGESAGYKATIDALDRRSKK